MSEYMNLELERLIDLLVMRTKEYDSMLSTRVFSEEEFTQCKRTLAELHAAIKVKAKDEGFDTNNIFPNFPENELVRQGLKNNTTNLGNNDVDQ